MTEERERRAADLLPRLLAGRDRLSRPEQEQIFARVVAGAAARPSRRRAFLFALTTAAAAAGLVWMIAPPPSDDFAPRGGGDLGVAFEVFCSREGVRTACAPGAKLLFELDAGPSHRYFAAFARRSDGTVLWYFPSSEAASSLAVVAGVAPTGIALGPEHTPGEYEVTGVFTPEPASRRVVRELVGAGAAHIVRRKLEVSP